MALTIEETINSSSPNNKKWFHDFINAREAVGLGVSNHRSIIKQLYEYFEHKDINLIEVKAIGDFLIGKYDKATSFSSRVDYLKSFFEYLVDQNVSLKFTIKDYEEVLNIPKDYIKEEVKREAIPLTINEIIQIRKTAQRKQDYKTLFNFEMFFYTGIGITFMKDLTRNKYNPETKTFILRNNKYKVNEEIHDLIMNKDVLKVKEINYRIKKMGEWIGRPDLISRDIVETSKKFFTSCPVCDTRYEMQPKNWAILEYDLDHSKWIVCLKCAEGKLK